MSIIHQGSLVLSPDLKLVVLAIFRSRTIKIEVCGCLGPQPIEGQDYNGLREPFCPCRMQNCVYYQGFYYTVYARYEHEVLQYYISQRLQLVDGEYHAWVVSDDS